MATTTMLTAQLIRFPSTDQGTLGVLRFGAEQCFSLELPDRQNASQISRIPEGTYTCKWVKTPKHGWCYQVMEVPGRGSILIHSGTFAGDVSLGFRTHSHGCILPCQRWGRLEGQLAGLVSRPAVRQINEWGAGRSFLLEVGNV